MLSDSIKITKRLIDAIAHQEPPRVLVTFAPKSDRSESAIALNNRKKSQTKKPGFLSKLFQELKNLI